MPSMPQRLGLASVVLARAWCLSDCHANRPGAVPSDLTGLSHLELQVLSEEECFNLGCEEGPGALSLLQSAASYVRMMRGRAGVLAGQPNTTAPSAAPPAAAPPGAPETARPADRPSLAAVDSDDEALGEQPAVSLMQTSARYQPSGAGRSHAQAFMAVGADGEVTASGGTRAVGATASVAVHADGRMQMM
mmetsp:Transcript_86664/g.245743  ORF Transcript_86664/g.245743 Transcript_86664/m.245743 type:complete len:191 (-) Transcript_86664:108-680(-)